jgi:hypothetical protein
MYAVSANDSGVCGIRWTGIGDELGDGMCEMGDMRFGAKGRVDHRRSLVLTIDGWADGLRCLSWCWSSALSLGF